MKRIRLLDAVLLLGIVAVAAGLAVRTWRPDLVANGLTDLSRREPVTVFVAVPNPWRQPPLKDLPQRGDSQAGEGARDVATFVTMTGDTGYPVAVLHVRARVDAERRIWFNYGELLPGANIAFRPHRYSMEGIIVRVVAGFQEDPGGPLPGPA